MMFDLFTETPEDAREFRVAMVQTLEQLFEKDEQLVLLDADLASASKTKALFEKYPQRCFNAGVAEANMIGVAAGLSSTGLKPFTHTFGTFATRRVFDQVFLSVGYADLAVRMIGSDPGVCAELNGGTHMPFEDTALMRTVPKMTILEPADETAVVSMFTQMAQNDQSYYVRVPRKRKYKLYQNPQDIVIGKANVLLGGEDVALMASGVMVKQALLAAQLLEQEGIQATVVDMHTIKPLDEEAVLAAAQRCGAIVVCENHNKIGGLCSAVAETMAQSRPTPVEFVAVQDEYGEVGPIEYLAVRFGLTAPDIVVKAKFALARK